MTRDAFLDRPLERGVCRPWPRSSRKAKGRLEKPFSIGPRKGGLQAVA